MSASRTTGNGKEEVFDVQIQAIVLALLSALFAALTSILAKMGLNGINSTLATAIRTGVVLLMSWGMVFITGAQSGISSLTGRHYLFLILSGIATGLSWLFYYRALQLGEAKVIVPIDKLSIVITLILCAVILKEKFSVKDLSLIHI